MADSGDNLDARQSDFELKGSGDFVVFMPNHKLMAKTERREQDNRPQKFFHYKRITDGMILTFTEAEAFRMSQKSSHKVILQQIGVSDGSVYQHTLLNYKVKEACRACNGKGKVELRVNQPDGQTMVRDMECETCKGAGSFMQTIRPGQSIPRALAEKILRDARDAEIESAKGHYQEPESQEVHFDSSFPQKLRPTFVPPPDE